MAILQKRKKKTVRVARRTGAYAAPVEKGYDAVMDYFQTQVDRKEVVQIVKSFIQTNYGKAEAKKLIANPDYVFSHSYMGAMAFWYSNGHPITDRSEYWKTAVMKRFEEFVETGSAIVKEKSAEAKVESNVIVLSPLQRLQRKINNTIMQDLSDLQDSWINEEKTTIDVYSLFKKHGLAGSATTPVRKVIEGWLLDYEDAYNKRCDQAVEGYSHLKRPELNRRLKACQDMLLDLDKIKSAAKAVRKTKVKQPKAADKQVQKVQYKKEDPDFKLASINPVQIVGKVRLYAFNTKSRVLTEFVTQSTTGFQITGTSIKNIDAVNSRSTKLRKPDEFLALTLSKTVKQIDTAWKKLTTKNSVPTGRLNKDMILLRVMDK